MFQLDLAFNKLILIKWGLLKLYNKDAHALKIALKKINQIYKIKDFDKNLISTFWKKLK